MSLTAECPQPLRRSVPALASRLWVGGHPGRGAANEAEPAHLGVTGARPVVLLVMELTADLRPRLEMALRFSGCQVIHAADGAQAVQLLDQGLRPALVLADPAAPGVAATDFAPSLRERLRGAPVVVAGRAAVVAQQAFGRSGAGGPGELLTLLQTLAAARG